jgi:hypothetical protein
VKSVALLIGIAACGVMIASRGSFETRIRNTNETEENNQSKASHAAESQFESSEQSSIDYLYPKTSGEIDLEPTLSLSTPTLITIGELPFKVRALLNVLQHLEETTLRTFESAPKFGMGRAPLRPPEVVFERKPEVEHSPLPDHDHFRPSRTLDYELHGKYSAYDESWMWFEQMRGLTSRGFVYRIRDRDNSRRRDDLSQEDELRRYFELERSGFFVVSLPVQEEPKSFFRRVGSLRGSAIVDERERLWEVEKLQLVSLLKHDPPAIYENRRVMSNSEREDMLTRSLDQIESTSLNELRGKTDCVIAWNAEHDRIQMLGAIRAKAKCIKCHEVEEGHLLGAFTYWISEVKHSK